MFWDQSNQHYILYHRCLYTRIYHHWAEIIKIKDMAIISVLANLDIVSLKLKHEYIQCNTYYTFCFVYFTLTVYNLSIRNRYNIKRKKIVEYKEDSICLTRRDFAEHGEWFISSTCCRCFDVSNIETAELSNEDTMNHFHIVCVGTMMFLWRKHIVPKFCWYLVSFYYIWHVVLCNLHSTLMHTVYSLNVVSNPFLKQYTYTTRRR